MKEMFKSKVMVCFMVFMLAIGYINSVQVKMENERANTTDLVVVNA